MNKAAFLNIVRQVAPIEDQEVEDLERLVVTFPYCQTAHVLLAKAAHDRGSMLSNQKLRKAAAHVSNRQLLKKLVYAPALLEEVAVAEGKLETEHPLAPAYATPVLEEFSEKEAENELSAQPEEVVAPEQNTPAAEQPNVTAEIDHPAVSSEEELTATLPEESSALSTGELVPGPALAAAAEETAENTPAPFTAEEQDVFSMDTLLQVDLMATSLLPTPTEQEDYYPAQEPKLAFSHDDAEEALLPLVGEENPEEEPALVSDAAAFTAEKPVSPDAVQPDEIMIPAASAAITPEDELLDLIHIDSLSALTVPYPSVNLSRAEIVSNIVSTSETAFYNQEGKVNLEEVMALAAADRELEDLPPLEEELEMATAEPTVAEIPEDQLFPWETPGYQIPTLQYDLLSQQHDTSEAPPASADAYTNILSQNSLGYWMDSSRMGESLQLRDELTSATPFYFQPELILEHVKGNGKPEPEPAPVQANRLDQQLNIIDQFLKASPKLKAVAQSKWKDEPIEDLSAKSSKIKKSLASENLAQIYIKQGKGRKAIKIYEQLIVKYPEKKGYFAEQIEKLRNEP